MKKERELAELIFDKFRQVNCKECNDEEIDI